MASEIKESKYLGSSSKGKSQFLNEKNSSIPLNNLIDDSGDPSERDYKFQRRMGRQFSINCRPTQDNKFYKVIIPYNFDLKKYWINKKEIEFYENKRYLEKKLVELNDNPTFNIDKIFEPRMGQKLCLYLPTIFLAILTAYLALILIAFFSFNPVIIYTIISWFVKGLKSLMMFKFILFEKFKIKEIHKILDEENKSPFCVEHKLKWILGMSGYWLEVQKLIE
jgi:hypothetical protein